MQETFALENFFVANHTKIRLSFLLCVTHFEPCFLTHSE